MTDNWSAEYKQDILDDLAFHRGRAEALASELAALRQRLEAARALATAAQRLSRRSLPALTGEPEFTIDPQDLAALDFALRQWREVSDG